VFHGPDGVGKEKFALGLAELLLCGAPVEQVIQHERSEEVGLERLRAGCGQCVDCRTVAAQTHPDLHLIYRQLNREHPEPEVRKRKALDIGVDVVRHFVIEKVGLTPNRGRAKVFVVREADRMTVQAQNALLKTLEEPPGTTFILLLVAALDRLLPTTLSRCQAVPFDSLPLSFIRGRLHRMLPNMRPEEVEWYARCSDGSLGQAIEWAEDGLCELNRRLLDDLAKAWNEESKALGDRYRKRDPDITETEAQRRGLKTIFRLAATWYADILRLASGDDATIANAAQRDRIARLANSVDSPGAAEAINRIARAERHLDLNVNAQICVEALLNDLARLGKGRAVPLGAGQE
jgi:DNA polymerase-3 subunit delta'